MKAVFVAETLPYPGNIYQQIERLRFATEVEAMAQAARWQALGHNAQVWKEQSGRKIVLHYYPTH